jgi:hypothetical protein
VLLQRLFSKLLRQLAEKIDRMRTHAGTVLQRLLYPGHEGGGGSCPHAPLVVPHREHFETAFPR